MIRQALPAAVMLLCTAFAGGCSNVQTVETVTLLNHKQCQNLKPGLTETSLDRISSLRQSRLLPAPDDAPVKPEQSLPQLEATRLFALSKGPQPTPGYAFADPAAELDAGTLRLRVRWERPPADAMLAQVMTHPCLVIGIPQTNAEVLVAEDQEGEIARIKLR